MQKSKLNISDLKNNYLFGTKAEQALIGALDEIIAKKPVENFLLVALGILIMGVIYFPPGWWIVSVAIVLSIVAGITSKEYCKKRQIEKTRFLEDIGIRLSQITNYPVPQGISVKHFNIRYVRDEAVEDCHSVIRVSFFEGEICYVGERCRGEWCFFVENEKGCKLVLENEQERLVSIVKSIL